MKNVLMFGWEYPPEVSGGLGIATYGLLGGLAKQGASVNFVIPAYKKKPGKAGWKIIQASDVRVKATQIIDQKYWEKISYIEAGTLLMPYISTTDYKKLEKKEKGVTREVKVLNDSYEFKGGYGETLMKEVTRFALVGAELATAHDVDVIHAHDWMTFPAALAAGAKSGKPVILHVHSTEIERSFPRVGQAIYDLERHCLANADHVIAVSHLTEEILIKHYELDQSKISVVHNSFSPEFKQPVVKKKFPSKTPTITFLGRMARQKAPALFVDVAKTLSDRNDNYRFVMAGDGYLLNDIKEKVERLNLTGKFSFPGFLKVEEVKKLMAKTDVFLFPASSEPFGMVALEAAFSGVPVILSKQTGAAEALPSAQTFQCWETFKMANAIIGLMNDPEKTLKYTHQLQQEAKKESWEEIGKKVLKIYQGLN